MIRAMVRGAILTAGVALAATPARAQDSGIEIGSAAPNAAVQTLDGKPADLTRLIGKRPMLIEFWATWCPNCKELEPAVRALHTKYGSRIEFVGIAVSVNESLALVNRYVDNHKLKWLQLYDARGNAAAAYDVPATSYVVLIDKAGKVVYTGLGGKQDLEKAIKKIL